MNETITDEMTEQLLDGNTKGKSETCNHDCFKANVATLTVEPDDVLMLKFDPDILPPELETMMNILRAEFPNNKVLGITSNMDILCEQRDDAIALLEGMLAHIKIVGDTKPQIML